MSVVLIQRTGNPGIADSYYLEGTGWQAVEADATSYATKEAALVDAETQKELLGAGSRILTKDLTTGAEWVVPLLQQ